MADPLSTIISVLDLVKRVKGLYDYLEAVHDAPETLRSLHAQTSDVVSELEWIQERANEAQAGDTTQKEFLKLYEKGPNSALSDGLNEPWRYGAVLQELQRLFRRLDLELRELDPKKARERVERASDPTKQSWLKASTEPSKSSKAVRHADMKLANEGRSLSGSTKFKRFFHNLGHKPQDTKWGRAILLPIQQEEFRKDLEDLHRLRSILQDVKARSLHDLARATRQESRDREEREDFRQAVNWLSPWPIQEVAEEKEQLDPFGNKPIASDWLLDREEFTAWKEGPPWRLFLYGSPGSGKSILATQIIQHLQDEHRGNPGVAVLFLALKYDNRKAQTPGALWRALLTQLVVHHGTPDTVAAVRDLWSRLRDDTKKPPPDQVRPVLELGLERLQRAFIIVDGLDETTDDVRKALQDNLTKIANRINATHGAGKISLMFSSRPLDVERFTTPVRCSGAPDGKPCAHRGFKGFHTCAHANDHEQFFRLCPRCSASGDYCSNQAPHCLELEDLDRIDIRLEPPPESIEKMVTLLIDQEMSIGSAGRKGPGRSDETTGLSRIIRDFPGLRESIISAIRDNAQGLYMLARMQWLHVHDSKSKSQVEKALMTLPKELDGSFEDTLKRMTGSSVSEDNQERAKRVVLWVSQTRRLLTLDDLKNAMSIEDDEEGLDKTSLLALTRGMVTVDSDECVRLVHRTAYEYLDRADVQQRWFPDAQKYMACMCLKTLLQNDVLKRPVSGNTIENETAGIVSRLKKSPFLSYAAQYWGFHAQSCQQTPEVATSIRQLLTEDELLKSVLQIAEYCEEDSSSGWRYRHTGVNPLHVAAWFGLESAFEMLISRGFVVDGRDRTFNAACPLVYACCGGRSEAVQELIKLGADVNSRDGRVHRPPIFHAIMHGQAPAVAALCACKDVDVNARMELDRTPLMQAAQESLAPAIIALLERADLEVNLQDSAEEMTALMIAAQTDSVETIDALLRSKDVDIAMTNALGSTALHIAAAEGHQDIVRMLLKHKADPEARDLLGATPLRKAVDFGHHEVVNVFKSQQLLSPTGTEDSSGQNLLFSAAINGHVLLVKELIKIGFNVNAQDYEGCTPLHAAAGDPDLDSTTKLDIMKILLEANADRTTLNFNAQSAADLAYENGDYDIGDFITPSQEGIARKHDDASLPATSLARRGLTQELERRASVPDNDLLKPGPAGETPLAISIYCGNYECSKILLDAYAAKGESIDVPNIRNRTPMHEAAKSTEAWLVDRMLSHKPPPALDLVDNMGTTPLSEAIDNGAEQSLIALIEAGAEFRPSDEPTEKMLSAAIEANNTIVVQKLIYAGSHIAFSHRALAKKQGNVDIIRLVDKHKTGLQLGLDPVDAELLGLKHDEDGDVSPPELPSVPKMGPDMSKPAFRAREDPIPT